MLLFAPACLFPDLGDLQGDAAPDVSTRDVIDDAKPIESGAEAGNDGGVDSSNDADAGPEAGFCASLGGSHALCEDFDESTLFSQQFTSVNTSANGKIGNDTTIVKTPPRSVLSSIPALGSASGDDAHMKRLFTGTATKATYAFDFRVDSLPAGGPSGVFAQIIIDDAQPTRHALSIYVTDTYSAVEESITTADAGILYKDHQLAATIPIGKWVRISMGLDATARTCTVSVDGQTVLSSVMDPSWKAGTVTMDLGLSYVASETTAWQARYDDVVFDFQ